MYIDVKPWTLAEAWLALCHPSIYWPLSLKLDLLVTHQFTDHSRRSLTCCMSHIHPLTTLFVTHPSADHSCRSLTCFMSPIHLLTTIVEAWLTLSPIHLLTNLVKAWLVLRHPSIKTPCLQIIFCVVQLKSFKKSKISNLTTVLGIDTPGAVTC